MNKLLNSLPLAEDLGKLLLRVVAGGIMLLDHGWPKLAGFSGMADTFPDPIGLGPGLSLGLIVFAEVLGRSRDALDSGQPLLVAVDARVEGDELKLMAQSFEPLEVAAASAAQGLRIYATDPQPLESVKSILQREGKGRGRVAVVLDLGPGEELEFELAETYKLTAAGRQAIKGLAGLVVQDL